MKKYIVVCTIQYYNIYKCVFVRHTNVVVEHHNSVSKGELALSQDSVNRRAKTLNPEEVSRLYVAIHSRSMYEYIITKHCKPILVVLVVVVVVVVVHYHMCHITENTLSF